MCLPWFVGGPLAVEVAEGFSAGTEGAPTSKPHGLEHMCMRRPGRDEVLLQQETGDLNDGTEGSFQDSFCPVAGQGAGCLHQLISGCRGDFWSHFRL